MKHLLTTFLLCSLSFSSLSQQCYQPLRAEGQALLQQKDYEEALNRYLAALSCPDRPRNDDLPQLIKAALRARVEQLEAARRKTETALAQARSAALAAKARQIYPDDQTVGLLLAGAAYRLDPGGREAAEALRDFFDNRQLHFYRHALWHDDLVEDLAFAPDGRALLTVSLDSTARLWDLEGNLLKTFPHPAGINCVAFAPDGSYFLTGAEDEVVRKWSPAGELLASFNGFEGGQEGVGITTIAIDPSGKAFTAGTYGGPLKTMTPQGEVLNEASQLKTDDIAYSNDDGSLLFTADNSGNYSAFLINTGVDTILPLQGHTSYLKSVAFSPDGQYLLTAAQDGTARLWNRRGETLTVFDDHEGSVRHAIFGPDQNSVITACTDHRIRFFDLEGNLQQVFRGHRDLVDRLALSPDETLLASGSHDGAVKLWPLPSVGLDYPDAHAEHVKGVQWLPGGRRLITWEETKQSFLRDEAGDPTAILPGAPLAMAPDEEQILLGRLDNRLRLCDLEGNPSTTFIAGEAPIVDAVFAADGNSLIAIDDRTNLFRWSLDGSLTETRPGPLSFTEKAVLSPDGTHAFALSGNEREAIFWKAGSNEPLLTLAPEEGHFFMSVAFSPDGRYLITGSSSGSVIAWNRQGKQVRRFAGLFDGITTIHCTPDQEYLLAGCILGPVRIWKFDSGQELQSVYPLNGFTTAAAFSPDGKKILIGDADAGLRIYPRWDVLIDEILPPLTEEQRTDFGLPVVNE